MNWKIRYAGIILALRRNKKKTGGIQQRPYITCSWSTPLSIFKLSFIILFISISIWLWSFRNVLMNVFIRRCLAGQGQKTNQCTNNGQLNSYRMQTLLHASTFLLHLPSSFIFFFRWSHFMRLAKVEDHDLLIIFVLLLYYTSICVGFFLLPIRCIFNGFSCANFSIATIFSKAEWIVRIIWKLIFGLSCAHIFILYC